ncbi:HNH endonuclease [Rhizobium ruizarguesonis]|uniref:HNH endonuclease n=1 Tax=Rhizobium ruizarguesonis TaxID=2081791 RepID=UPI00102FF629|nr:hypothetical protein [Rhizobium ruizarguesonis]TBB95746.1 hypothetical protein ELH38_26750 [Rhizobium ruizarguesonis]
MGALRRPYFFEAHHVLPLHAINERKTKLAETTLLCANCHRLTHYITAKGRRWISVAEMRAVNRIGHFLLPIYFFSTNRIVRLNYDSQRVLREALFRNS